ncbi:MAG: AlpA family phage regulatory protein [Pseudomonadota bacterium]
MPTDLTQRPMVLRKRTVCNLLGISRSTLDRLRARGDFPAPISLTGAQAVGWLSSTVLEWLTSRETKTTH